MASTTAPAAPAAPAVKVSRRTPATVAAVDILAGFLAGINVTVVGHPLEVAKVRLQTQPSPPNQIYNGVVDCLRKTLQWEGFGGLYKGVAAPLAGQLFFRSLMFWTNAVFVRTVAGQGEGKPLRAMSYFEYAVGGSVAWGVGSVIECPLQLASSQLQTAIVRAKAAQAAGLPPPVIFNGIVDYARRAPSLYGIRAFYHGIGPHLMRNIPAGFFHFGVFEGLRREVAKSKGVAVTDIGLLANMACGSIGGVFFWGTTYPIDVIKSALQGDSLDPKTAKYKGFSDAARKLWAEGGAARFSRGFSACMLRAVPANAALLTTATRVRELGYDYLDGKW